MKNRKHANHPVRMLTLCAVLLALLAAGMAAGLAESPVQLSQERVLLMEQCEAVFDGSRITVTDLDDNNDVWSSRLLLAAGEALTPGEQYTVSFSLAGEAGVGEFFLCRSENIDDRYDETFAAEAGDRSIAFTAAGDRVYIGMQVGNLGKGRSVTADVGNLSLQAESAAPGLLRRENGTVTVSGDTVTAVDTGDNNDVWNSKLLYDTGMALEAGKTYKLDFTLTGDSGVGEFFVCKSRSMGDRDDGTFVNTAGPGSVVFTARCDSLVIGMQFGNLGPGGSVTLTITSLQPELKNESAQDAPASSVLLAENCTWKVETSGSQTVVSATDTSPETAVWTSKLLLSLGEILEKNKCYGANINLAGDNGVGEFFFLKEDNIDGPRYSFDNQPGDHTPKFKAEDSTLYAGMQFGNVGEGSEVTATIGDIFTIPGVMRDGSENVAESVARDTITLTDTGEDNAVWNSKAVYDTGIVLEPGKEYTATFTLTGDNGVGEFFFLKTDNIDVRYDSTFNNQPGTHTVTFTAEEAALYFGVQCGNIGSGNSVSVSGISVTPVE